jgi:hypothetical protein
MLAQFLFFLAALAVVWAFSSVGVFFLYFVWVHYKDGSWTPRALTLVEHMSLDLHQQAMKLDAVRLQMFTEWLQRHCRGIELMRANPHRREMQMDLKRWLETFEPDALHGEYRLLVSEIAWWREADEKTLLNCVTKEFIERYSSR